MNRKLLETEKNFLVCAILMTIVGIVMCIIDKITLGIITIVIGVIFLAISIRMILKNNKDDGANNG